MKIKAFDRLHGAAPYGPNWWETQATVPHHLKTLLARHGHTVVPGKHLSIHEVDKMLSGRRVAERLKLKCELRSADLID
jgi:hypothetical protein